MTARFREATMGDDLKSFIDNLEFVADMARYAENLATQQQLRKKYRLADDLWQRLGENDQLVEQIEAEKLRRIRNGASKRERAQKHVVAAPDILNSIMVDPSASPKHRIDASKVLDQFADNGPQAAPATDIFRIVINLGGDQKLVFDKELGKVNPHAGEIIDGTPQELLPMIAANKREDGDGGQSI